MTANEAKEIAVELAALSTEVKGLGDDVSEMRSAQTQATASLSKLETSMEGISSRTTAVLERNRSDIDRLFKLHGANSHRLSEHLIDHVPEDEIRSSFRRTDDAMARISGRVNVWAGFFVAMLVVIEIAKLAQGFFR